MTEHFDGRIEGTNTAFIKLIVTPFPVGRLENIKMGGQFRLNLEKLESETEVSPHDLAVFLIVKETRILSAEQSYIGDCSCVCKYISDYL